MDDEADYNHENENQKQDRGMPSRADTEPCAKGTHTNLLCYMKVSTKQLWSTVESMTKEEVLDEQKRLKELFEILRANDKNTLWSLVQINDNVTPLADIIANLWSLRIVQLAYRHPRSRIDIQLDYFMSQFSEIRRAEYAPTEQDILYVRERTVGVRSIEMPMEDKITGNLQTLHLVDVGGQVNERRKWMSQFDDVTTVLFVVALDAFDMPLVENDKVNRLQDQFQLFKQMVESPFFENTPFIVFLNKKDLLLCKIRDLRVDFKHFFPEYTGKNEYRSVVNWIREKFLEIHRNALPANSRPLIEFHNVVATDMNNTPKLIHSCQKIIVDELLKRFN